jgi:dTDP-4-amino-4,6-dideoxygalactose transaminase
MKFIRKKPWPQWPIYGINEKKAINKVLSTNQLFAKDQVKNFEKEFSNYNESKNVICVGNATQGLHLALAALNIGVGDEVIVTNYSWISTASCILMQNAVPIFCDIEEDTLAINPDLIKKKISKRTKAIIYVHMFGNVAQVSKLMKIAKENQIYLIEDASHAHGASYYGKKTGNFSDISVFSLHQRKNLSCGEGGVVICKDNFFAKNIYHLRSFGSKELSYNYRMTEFSAAIGRVRLKNLDKENFLRNKNAHDLFDLCKGMGGINFVKPMPNSFGIYHKLIIKYDYNIHKSNVDIFIKFINKIGIPIKKTYPPLNYHSHFNPKKDIARGIPWKWKLYSSKHRMPNNLNAVKFNVTNELSLKMLCELDINPNVKYNDLKDFRNALEIYLNLNKEKREHFISNK